MGYGCDYSKKKFTVQGGKTEGKKCFLSNCDNECKMCRDCMRIQGHWIHFKQKGDK